MLYMEKKIKLASKSQCTGCGACNDACPTASIVFRLSGLHYYPYIKEETCIKCGKCMNVCPPLKVGTRQESEDSNTSLYYCAWNKDSQERYNATSGGVGGALAKQALDEGWYVCGAAFTGEWELKHIVSNEETILGRIRGSKYLQSNTEGVYKRIIELLKTGERVLFLGTPCQTDALRSLVPSKYAENLLTCEIICHGVNSPVVWKDYREYIENESASKLSTYNFRSKSKGWGKLRVFYCFNNGKKVEVPAYRNIFHNWFGQHYMMRESCFRCNYRKTERYSDLIIGDFWGIESIEPTLDVKKGASVLIANTTMGRLFIENTDLNLIRVDAQKAQMVLKGFVDKMPEEVKLMQVERMKKFEKDYSRYTFKEMAFKHYPRNTWFKKTVKSVLFHLHIIK